MKTILVPVDFSSITPRVIAEAASLARTLPGRIVLVHVTEPVAKIVDYAVIVMSVAQINEAAVQEATRRLAEFADQLTADGLSAEFRPLTGSPVPEIVELSRELNVDYVVIGSHGHTAFYDLLVGGTASGVLKRAACTVVIVPPAPGERGRD